MGTNTKIVVIKAKKLIYSTIIIILGIIFLCLLANLFQNKFLGNNKKHSNYIPGVYSSTITLGEQTLNVNVTVDEDRVSGVDIENLNETVTTMYPLLQPALNEINEQITTVEDIDNISYSSENQYTYIILNQAIKNALNKAQPD